MKFYSDFNAMFNAQSGSKAEVSVFNKFSDLDSSFEGYEALFDCIFVPSKKRPDCYTYIIKPKECVLAKVKKYSDAYTGYDVSGAFPKSTNFRLSFYVDNDGKQSYIKVLCAKDNKKPETMLLDIDENIKDKKELFKHMRNVVLGTKFVEDIHNTLELWEHAFMKLDMYAEPGKI